MLRDWSGKLARMPEKLWRRLESHLPKYGKSRNGGRPRVSLRGVADGIFYLLRTACQRKALPPQFGLSSTGKAVEAESRHRGYNLHVPKGGAAPTPRRKGKRARRWVVEGSHSWANRARRLLVRWEKKADNYLAFVHLQFAYITLKHSGLLG